MHKPKLLYIGIHGILEYYELKLFHQMGFDVRSMGTYMDPSLIIDSYYNPSLPELTVDREFISKVAYIQSKGIPHHLTQDLINPFDIIILVHNLDYLKNNLNVLKNKLVIWRTVGHENQGLEYSGLPYRDLLKIVRWSPKAKLCPDFIGEEAVIRCPINEELFSRGWVGDIEKILTVKNCLYTQRAFNEMLKWEYLVKGFPFQLVGALNGDYMGGKSNATTEELSNYYQTHRLHIALPSGIAPYNMTFLEGLLAGIPTVVLGQKLVAMGHMYEQHELIQHGVNGICSDNLDELRDNIQELLKNTNLAKKIGEQGKILAKNLAGYETIKKQWKTFFNQSGINI